ncbi:FtsX-like permease family protein [Flammeovirgaceae bacterium SG7u.111]|nr:FtsX-like permease family protein [Flammeovirgaceae bacterium SG7u.132]WPO34045.1 FtsX-like permease family protein [Flammeovirgaceae bacterium SG7u.111]
MSKNNIPFFIAKRYFSSHRGKNKKTTQSAAEALIGQSFIKILSNIAMVGLGVGTAALIVILSVFNGLEELTISLYNTYNPELKITPKLGKTFELPPEIYGQLKDLDGVKAVTEVIEDGAMVRYGKVEVLVTVKGVSDNYLEQYDLKKAVVSGGAELKNGEQYRALLGMGVQHQLSVQMSDDTKAMVFYYPRRGERVTTNMDKAFKRNAILPGGVFAIEQQFDLSYVLVPLEFAQELMQYEEQRSSLEIRLAEGASLSSVQSDIKELIGEKFDVKTSEEQQASVLKAVKWERLFVFVTFVVVLGIASLNVFFALAMLVIEKKRDIAILFSVGATRQFVRKIFMLEGAIVAFTGVVFGLVLGFIIVFVQEKFGLVSLGVSSSIVDAYPVKMKWTDFALTAGIVVVITMVASYVPAKNASQTQVNEHV